MATLHRAPSITRGHCLRPASVHQLRVQKREGGEGVRVWIDGLDGLLTMEAVELHPWNAKVDDIEHADRVVLDLDPGEGVPWDQVIEAALSLRDILEAAGLESWPKVTGGKGIHLMAPLTTRMTHDRARQLARSLAQCLVDAEPERYLLSADPVAIPRSALFRREHDPVSRSPIL
ncbi:DNA ligase D (fragment) [Mesorhizobium sp. SOD10]